MRLRPSVADQAFDASRFEQLREALRTGRLGLESGRLARAPDALPSTGGPLRGRPEPPEIAELARIGEHAIRAGRVACVVLNGGMATRFGGEAKGVVPVIVGGAETFLSLKLAACARIAEKLAAAIPVVVMNSFATREASLRHLDEIGWAGVAPADRACFDQSIMPRLTFGGEALTEIEGADALSDRDVYAAPGHGDALGRLRESGTLARLRERGVEHLIVSNVDNLGAKLDPVVLGAHLAAVANGADVTVEVVRRRAGDAGGCVALVEDRPIVVEGFRLPAGTDLSRYPHFNTNTLWLRAAAIDRELELTWFPVHKTIPLPDGRELDAIQLERLIGQVTELLPSAFVEVDRDDRFVPIKTRDELTALESVMRRLVEAARA